ncbi:MAG: hypothetical protein TYPL_0590 [Candidatus Tyloplasma litorale]|nr:MAG: hypothetical protein TYPL_0590 [Mycoplasmatales bacterium]
MNMNRKYEVLLLINDKLEENDIEKTLKDVEAKLCGNIIKKEKWGIKDLAYEINKSKKAYYVLYYVETTPEAISDLKKLIAIDKRIVRPMILVHNKKWPFEYKTAKDLKFPERKKKEYTSRNYKNVNNYSTTKQPIAKNSESDKSKGE